jgi:lipopolysaccharide transport system ATP-binding protein
MAHVEFRDVSVDIPIFNATGRSLTSKLLEVATGGRLDADPQGRVLVRALNNLSFTLNEGDRVGLVGHNGSGKSTLLRALGGVYAPTNGTADITGDIGSLIDYTNFVYVNEAFFNVCFPRRLKGYFKMV